RVRSALLGLWRSDTARERVERPCKEQRFSLSMSETMSPPKVLALDLEGTLISNAVSQIPRPGLFDFLTRCRDSFSRIVMFTTVSEKRFRDIAGLLVKEGFAPTWFA